MGDVPGNIGVSTDIVVRALRPLGLDLQERIFTDKTENPEWCQLEGRQHQSPDQNIDHRRVVNQAIYAKRFGTELPCAIGKPIGLGI